MEDPISLSKLKSKVIENRREKYRIVADVIYSDNSVRRIFAENDYWLEKYAKMHG